MTKPFKNKPGFVTVELDKDDGFDKINFTEGSGLLTQEELEKVKEGLRYNLTLKQIVYDSGVDYDRLMSWLAYDDNLKKSEIWREGKKIALIKKAYDTAIGDGKIAIDVLSRIAKDDGWSSRTEVTGKNGQEFKGLQVFIPQNNVAGFTGVETTEETNHSPAKSGL